MSSAGRLDLIAAEKIHLAEVFTKKTPKNVMKQLVEKGDNVYLPGTPERIAIYRKRYQRHIVLNSGERFPDHFRHAISGVKGDIKYMPKMGAEKSDPINFRRLKNVRESMLRILSDSSAE